MINYLSNLVEYFGFIFSAVSLIDDIPKTKDKNDSYKLGYLIREIEDLQQDLYSMIDDFESEFRQFEITSEDFALILKKEDNQ